MGKKEVSRIKKCLLSYQRSQDFEDRTISFNFVREKKRRESTESVFARSLLVTLMRIVVVGGGENSYLT